MPPVDSTLAAVSIGLGIVFWDYISMLRQEMKMLATFSDHRAISFCFTTLRCLSLFLLSASFVYLLSEGSACHVLLICMELLTIAIFIIHSIVLFSFPTSFRSDRKWRVVALSCSIVFFIVMVTVFIISAVHSFSHKFDPNLTCVILSTENWKLVGLGAPILFSLIVLLHFLQMGLRERAMMPYFFDIVCMGLVTIVLIVALTVISLDVVSDQVAFVLRMYIILVIDVVDSRLLLKRARESERVEGIPLPSSSLLGDGGGEEDDLTMETASLESHHSLPVTHDEPYYAQNRVSMPFGSYGYNYASHLEDGKKPEFPIVNREVKPNPST